ncbi:ExeA family protein [Pseudoalteromonas luteoviolacea]|uniref:ATPase AAA n=1 Tax=Pseudoalteromonas luteoviolacea DSM 6061 TaxID=1365250 RepID=A0A166X3Y1_9GAMM|nr:AAA family ATPase [Pseudoalteromonas luteoviolacea]KZN39573.1 ATPase AAA [Pseudoalteromonas luteoviolacea DSM 6061]KZN57842.1 ATPase AAA [Pseudoalteromonas luteoviolacea CPMOR-2]MBE0388376.1 general secretion pathway protein A [Pseudoalteromonas luteoviolacea DSM 6061]TQF66880.1 AAA family ATPase [Pseudoalteromonas luteoviolacea]
MYLRYFGLTEKPFSIAPNPEFLFLSDRHKEALAHLTYGLGDAGGFVLLTGEVGTGKTTVTRSMLAQLPESTQVAFVLNPALSEMELLASICDELDIEYDAKEASLKSLTDVIKARLLENHEHGGHTMLIIDEAQHLAAEVLEQLRLLTNLETDHKKLLQIVLVGQPELQQLLQRNELRQLAQRITARYHLLPLTESQVFSYIKHRLNKAGCDANLFSDQSIQYIHQVTAGIPRLINLLADRCLLGAYSSQQQEVSKQIAQEAAKEALPLNLIPEQQKKSLNVPALVSGWVAAMFACGFGLSFLF